MFATWLLPYNEMVAGWVDPFYDAGNLSHTGIMGNIGTTAGIFYNTGMFNDGDSFGDFDYSTANFSAFDTEAGQNYGGAGTYASTIFSMNNPTNGESVTNKNLPPYYALCFIVKT